MPLTIQRTIDAVSEPVGLSELKDHLRVADTNSDAYITSLINPARVLLEEWTGRQFLTATWVMAIDFFPWQFGSNARFSAPLLQLQGGPLAASPTFPGFGNFFDVFDRQMIRLPRPPLQSVTSVAYIDTNGQQQTLDSSLYLVDSISEPARLSPAYGQVWPAAQAQINAVTITFVAGWTTGTMPNTVKHAMKLLVNHWYEHREAMATQELKTYPLAIQSLVGILSYGDYR